MMGHFSPLAEDSVQLAEGDIAKLVTGSHLDGFSANAATTVCVGEGKVRGNQADTVMAAYHAIEAAQRCIRVGGNNYDVTDAIARVCEEYKVNPVEGVLSHKIKKHLVDGNDVIINKETPEQRVEEYEFCPGDVIGLDVFVSSGEGKPKEADTRTTVFKRDLQNVYNLKMKSSRAFFTEMGKRYPTLPFSIRQFEDTTAAKVGVTECLNHDLLQPYPVLQEKVGEVVAQFQRTVAILPRSTVVLAGQIALDEARFEGDNKLSAETSAMVTKDMW